MKPADRQRYTDWPAQLAQGLQAMAQPLGAERQALLLDYLHLLDKWNRVFNLTAVRDPAIMVRRQLLDSLSILPWVDQGPVLDVGSGAGLPGIPLAIARPQLAFSLLDTNGKKTRFLRQAVSELGLANVEVLKTRVEALERPRHYARITSRAFATLADMVAGSRSLLSPDGRWLAMKGAAPVSEIGDLPVDVDAAIETLKVPGEPGARHLAVIRDLVT
jgi:16S rRNA (guanine527-N7)-methyltransferase